MHEPVKAAGIFEYLRARPQIKMIGVAQDNPGPDVLFQLSGCYPFDAAGSADRHKNRCRDLAMIGVHQPDPGFRGRVGVEEVKG
jgi:hypothetical protein